MFWIVEKNKNGQQAHAHCPFSTVIYFGRRSLSSQFFPVMRKHYRVMELCLLSNLSFDKKEKPLPDGRGLSRKREEKGERNSYEFPRSGDRGAHVAKTGLDEFFELYRREHRQ